MARRIRCILRFASRRCRRHQPPFACAAKRSRGAAAAATSCSRKLLPRLILRHRVQRRARFRVSCIPSPRSSVVRSAVRMAPSEEKIKKRKDNNGFCAFLAPKNHFALENVTFGALWGQKNQKTTGK